MNDDIKELLRDFIEKLRRDQQEQDLNPEDEDR